MNEGCGYMFIISLFSLFSFQLSLYLRAYGLDNLFFDAFLLIIMILPSPLFTTYSISRSASIRRVHLGTYTSYIMVIAAALHVTRLIRE